MNFYEFFFILALIFHLLFVISVLFVLSQFFLFFQQVPTTPKEFIESLQSCSLKGEKRLKVLESLRVSLSSNPVRSVLHIKKPHLTKIKRKN